jgi:hypothetical protein
VVDVVFHVADVVVFVILQHPSIFMPFVDNLCCFVCNGMITSMLEPHLASVGATTNDVGVTFLVLGAVFMVSTPLAGMVSFHFRHI